MGRGRSDVERLRNARWKARTDLYFLSKYVLGYKDIDKDVHGPVIDIVQQFILPDAETRAACDRYEGGKWDYTAWCDPYERLKGQRRVLILDPRGGLKTTLNAISHTIQWILNFPDLAFFIVQSNTEKAQDIIKEIKAQFSSNMNFRELFPDYCPQKKVFDWGNRNEFTVPNRKHLTRKEPTCMAGSIDKGSAGYHFDVMKFSDIVEPNNTRTKEQIESVIFSFAMFENLLVRPDGWMDVEGTRYHFYDLYGKIIEKQQDEYRIHVRGCYQKNTNGKAPTFSPAELELPDLINPDGTKNSWWPKRFPYGLLEQRRKVDEYVFGCQMKNNPVDTGDDQVPFPLKMMKWKTREDFAKIPLSYHITTVDTADTITGKSDYTVITTCAYDKYGRCYVHDIRHGRMLPDQIVDTIFSVHMKYRPAQMRVEETAFVRGLKSSIGRRRDIYGINPTLVFLKRETTISKQERILLTLQPAYKNGEIFFLTDLVCREHLIHELSRFPKWHDDILDTLADQYQGRDWFGREAAGGVPMSYEERVKTAQEQDWARRIGLTDPDELPEHFPAPSDPYYSRTGGL